MRNIIQFPQTPKAPPTRRSWLQIRMSLAASGRAQVAVLWLAILSGGFSIGSRAGDLARSCLLLAGASHDVARTTQLIIMLLVAVLVFSAITFSVSLAIRIRPGGPDQVLPIQDDETNHTGPAA